VELYTKETDIIIAGACAYASSYPPVGDWIDDTRIGFTGTPWYEVTLTPEGGGADETVKSGGTFLLPCSYTVSSFTDRTGAPGIINCKAPTALTLAASPETICAGEPATLTASATGAVAYSLDGSSWQAEAKFKVTPSSSTAHTLYAQTVEGCVATLPNVAVVTVNPVPDPPIMDGGGTQCSPGTITATAAGPGGTGIRWDNNSTTSARTVTETGTYYAVTTSDAGCESSTATITVTVTQGSALNYAPNSCGCASGLVPCSGTCQNCCGCVSITTSCYQIIAVSNNSTEGMMDWETANSYCQSKGMRLPQRIALQCLCNYKSTNGIPGGYLQGADVYYWALDAGGTGHYLVQFPSSGGCGYYTGNPSFVANVKCVKDIFD
jgi:hypothetical protein